eukprot:460306-Pleurochrysis_carterae.AAC.1
MDGRGVNFGIEGKEARCAWRGCDRDWIARARWLSASVGAVRRCWSGSKHCKRGGVAGTD